MRLFLFLLLTFSFSHAIDKQIILGSYTIEENGMQALTKLNKTILKDPKLKEQVKVNALKSKMKRIGKYYVVFLAPLTTRQQLFRTLDRLKPYYDDVFVLEMSEPAPTQMLQVRPLPAPMKVVAKKEELPIAKKEQAAVPKPIVPQLKKLKEVQKVQPKEENSYSLYFIILLIIVVAMGTSYVIFRRKNS
ncbi:hypothetical protein [Sulfurimonas sp. HSL-1716]|uniref:hypothetical protein n=1 Tax=Hydrocurvibacter sulfurireducens TaxID=3131937 RepID=UPI0031F8184F